ncbi:MAG: hypothetical protein AUK48_10225 [Oscillatoriales cyanobacterium CG2_30_44_21]|nr:MAG: hypothetical protein AUK48_10225 [Oscillatoriales cyanobacterium CG2_30_44_21]
MKKSFIYRSLQAAIAVAVCALLVLWVSTTSDNAVLEVVTELDSLAVIVAIAFVFPYICFKALSKLYTPPVSRNNGKLDAVEAISSQDDLEAIAANKLATMQYRGNSYVAEVTKSEAQFAPVAIKYRGVSIEPEVKAQPDSDQDVIFFAERELQKSAKPKERIKYRGSYVD